MSSFIRWRMTLLPWLPGIEVTMRRSVPAVLSVMMALSACATPSSPPVVSPSTQSLGRDLPVYQPSPGEKGRPEGPTFNSPVGAISLQDALALALLHSPDLAAFAWETRAREARALQAGRLPNPVLEVLAEDVGAPEGLRGGSGSQRLIQPQTTIQLSQLVELGGKRTARQKLATLNRDLAAWDYEIARIDVLTQTTRNFIDVLAAQELVTLTSRTTELVEQVEQSVGARVVAGVVSPVEQTKAGVALAGVRVESGRARRVLDASRGRLAGSWGSTEAGFRFAVGDLREVAELPPLVELTARLAETPELGRWTAEISQRQSALSLERSRRVPDVEVTAGFRRFTGLTGSSLLFGAAVALPIFDFNGRGVQEASLRLAKGYEERRAAQARVSVALAEGYRALSSAHEELTALRTTVLPGAQQAFEAVSEGYRLGKFEYLDVLDAQRTLIGAGGQYLRTLSDYHKAAADVERLIGAPLVRSAVPPAPPGKE